MDKACTKSQPGTMRWLKTVVPEKIQDAPLNWDSRQMMHFVFRMSQILLIVFLKFKFNWKFSILNLLNLATLPHRTNKPHLSSERFISGTLNFCQIITSGNFY